MSQASDRATASVANLATKVDALIAANTASNQDPAFTAIADQADAEAAKVDAALNPVVAEPAPAPEGEGA